MTPTYNELAANVNNDFTLFNQFGKKRKSVIYAIDDISYNARRLLDHLSFREYKDGFVSECQESIARLLNLTTRTIRNLTKILVEKKYIKIDVPSLGERRSLGKKIIYKILPDRFIKKPEEIPKEKQPFSGDFSGENGNSTYRINKELKEPLRDSSIFSEKFLMKQIEKGKNINAVNEAVQSVEQYKGNIKNPYAYFFKVLSIANGNYNEREYIKEQNELYGEKEDSSIYQVEHDTWPKPKEKPKKNFEKPEGYIAALTRLLAKKTERC